MSGVGLAQSKDQNFPTAVSSNEINGSIIARDLGDSRVTSFYYAFEGVQGDVFINVVTKNFVGDIDVFAQDGLKTLTKMVIFDSAQTETGRLVYLRKAEKLLLRIQGRTPNDDPATFRIKFGGSFVAIKGSNNDPAPVLQSDNDKAEVVVNSVGTILDRPKPNATVQIKKAAESDRSTQTARSAEPNTSERPKVANPSKDSSKATKPPVPKPALKIERSADPLASIRLKILMKDGGLIEKPMTEVSRFTVDKGVLTVIAKNGEISRFSILNVAKVTIE